MLSCGLGCGLVSCLVEEGMKVRKEEEEDLGFCWGLEGLFKVVKGRGMSEGGVELAFRHG